MTGELAFEIKLASAYLAGPGSSADFSKLAINLYSKAIDCAPAAAGVFKDDLKLIGFQLYDVPAGAKVGVYPLNRAGTAAFIAQAFADGRAPKDQAEISEGTLSLLELTPSHVRGSFELVLGAKGRLKGQFDAAVCAY